jgi:hypothetical protein
MMVMPMHGERFIFFPALDRADGSLQVRSDFFPGIQAIINLGICQKGNVTACLPLKLKLLAALPNQLS